jgi:hypothetical protein
MAGKIIADQIEHSTAGSLDTSYVVNGSAKHWVVPDTSYVVQDSLNTSSITDSGGGVPNDSVVSLTTSFSTVYYVTAGASNDASNPRLYGRDNTTTGSYGVDVYRVDDLVSVTSNIATTMAIGDLA